MKKKSLSMFAILMATATFALINENAYSQPPKKIVVDPAAVAEQAAPTKKTEVAPAETPAVNPSVLPTPNPTPTPAVNPNSTDVDVDPAVADALALIKKRPAIAVAIRSHLRRALIKSGVPPLVAFRQVNSMTDEVIASQIPDAVTIAKQTVPDASLGAIGDGKILAAIQAFFASPQGQAILNALVQLLLHAFGVSAQVGDFAMCEQILNQLASIAEFNSTLNV